MSSRPRKAILMNLVCEGKVSLEEGQELSTSLGFLDVLNSLTIAQSSSVASGGQ